MIEPSRAARTASLALAIVAGAALFANCLLTSPPKFSEKHEADRSVLKTVVTTLALGGRFPTVRGVEIRNLCFYVGASILAMIGGFRLLTSGVRPKMTVDDLLDLRSRAAGPYFWLALMMMVSVVTSVYAHAPDVSLGLVIVRFIHLAWWLPLAGLLLPRHVRGLSTALVAAMAATAVVGIWYHAARIMPELPDARLQYPIGNEVWFGACLLPAVFIAVGLAVGCATRQKLVTGGVEESTPSQSSRSGRSRAIGVALSAAALAVVLVALYLTRSRSALVGLAAGAFAFAVLVGGKRSRPSVALVGLLLAIGGVWYVQNLRTSGVMGQRAHSIRTRLNHEWPYALRLFFQKPVGGHGEGCYTMLAGSLARSDQLEDPSTIASDAHYWTAHAHNEYLELLADIGMAGAASFLLALVVTLVAAVKYSDRLRRERSDPGRRWLAMGLAAALVAMMVEEGSNVALRQPGFPPLFLTVWAVLWVLVRDARQGPETAPEEARIGVGTVRLCGALAVVASVILGYYGIQNWRAARQRFATESELTGGAPSKAIAPADFAGLHALDPMQRISARMLAVQARSAAFVQALEASEGPPTDVQLNWMKEARARIPILYRAAPRFLRLSRVAWELNLGASIAYRRRGDRQSAGEYFQHYVSALGADRLDEPFQIDLVERLWRDKPGATSVERLLWLRSLIRRSEMDERFIRLVRDIGRIANVSGVMDGLMGVALKDSSRRPPRWQDRLSPETLRLGALAKQWQRQPEEAIHLAAQAEEMYRKAGGRLFVAHAAAIHEKVRYQFHADPGPNIDEKLKELARAQRILSGPIPQGTLPIGEPGRTRLLLLLAAGREQEALAQLAVLYPDDPRPAPIRLGHAYAGLADGIAFFRRHAEPALGWAQRAEELVEDIAEAPFTQVGLFLEMGEEAKALAAAKRFIDRMPNRADAFANLSRLEARWQANHIWAELRRTYADFPDPPAATTQPSPVVEDAAPASSGPADE